MKKVCVIGLGYIGLPTSALLANRGYEVIGVDVNKSVVETINSGNVHIVEPDLDTFVRSAVKSGKLKAFNEPQQADIFMICVPTPFYSNTEPPQPNLEYVINGAKAIAPYVREGNIIILESTSPVGTTELIRDTLKENGVNIDKVFIAYCPERVLPGKIMMELIDNDRIVGGINEASTEKVKDFYSNFVNGDVLTTNSRTAEMCKLVENSYRDTNIAFANELSILCDKLGINVWQLIKLANCHPRVNILQPGCGVGGHCIAVDPWFIVAKDPENAKIIRSARDVNNYKTEWVIEKIKSTAYKFELDNRKKPTIACMGLAFKPDIDDLRESPALTITNKLMQEHLKVLAVEPNIENHNDFEITNYKEAIEKADIIVFLVKHKEFKTLEINNKILMDFCGIKQSKKTTASINKDKTYVLEGIV